MFLHDEIRDLRHETRKIQVHPFVFLIPCLLSPASIHDILFA